MKVHGRCHCGAIAYEAEVDPARAAVCHCVDCQILSGAPLRASVPARVEDFRLLRGTPKAYVKTAESGRRRAQLFCGDCGSSLFSRRETTPETTVLRAGAFDDPPEMKLTAHIWTKSARPWSYIDPASAQFPGQPDAPPVPK